MKNAACDMYGFGAQQGADAIALRYQYLRDYRVPVDGDSRHRCELGFSLEPDNSRCSVTACGKAINCQGTIVEINQPDFRDARSLVNRDLLAPVIARSAG